MTELLQNRLLFLPFQRAFDTDKSLEHIRQNY